MPVRVRARRVAFRGHSIPEDVGEVVPELNDLHKKAQQKIGEALQSGEKVLVAEPGEFGAIVATNRRVLVCKWGATTGHMFSSQVTSWDLSRISGIEYRKGMTTKSITVQASGTVPVSKFGRMDHGPGSVWEAPNSLFLTNDGTASVARIRALVAESQMPKPAPAPTPAAAAPALDPASQIRALAALRDDGILTDEEFTAKKRQILGL